MSFIQQFQSNVPVSRRRALLGLSLLALTACSRRAVTETADSNVAYYTCTMHPFVRSQDPKGKCPVCGMDLVPVAKSSADAVNAAPVAASGIVNIAPERMQEIGVTTEVVTKRSMTRSLRAPARAEIDEVTKHLGIVAQFWEDDAAVLSVGQKVTVLFPSSLLQKREGTVNFIAPHIDEQQHRITARILVPEDGHTIRPGAFAEVSGEISMGERLSVSTSAVLPTGNKYIAFVDHGGGKLEPREIEIGLHSDDNYEVLSGLSEGDRVVSSANFLIDAESRIQGVLKTWGDRP